jgi:hypothetical protein
MGGNRLRTWLALILGVIIGSAIFVFSVADLVGDHGVSCGGHQMKSGDTCLAISHGRSEHRDVAQQESKNRHQSWVGVIVGGLMTLGAGGIICRRRPAIGPTEGSTPRVVARHVGAAVR